MSSIWFTTYSVCRKSSSSVPSQSQSATPTDFPLAASITFVAGRTRAQISQEMETLLGLSEDEQPDGQSPPSLGPTDDLWEQELTRAIDDIGKIAQDRVSKMK